MTPDDERWRRRRMCPCLPGRPFEVCDPMAMRRSRAPQGWNVGQMVDNPKRGSVDHHRNGVKP